jgi:hypothetical protein
MRVYISGPITGMPDQNRPAFDAAELAIASRGHVPVNPLRVAAHLPPESDWYEYMRTDVRALLGCDAILLLEGWRDSRGARIEEFLSALLDIPRIVTVSDLEFYA